MIYFFYFSSKMEFNFFPFVTPTYQGVIRFPDPIEPMNTAAPAPASSASASSAPASASSAPAPASSAPEAMQYFLRRDRSPIIVLTNNKLVSGAKEYARQHGIDTFYFPYNKNIQHHTIEKSENDKIYRLNSKKTTYVVVKEGIETKGSYGLPIDRTNVDDGIFSFIKEVQGRDHFKDIVVATMQDQNMNTETSVFIDKVIDSIRD